MKDHWWMGKIWPVSFSYPLPFFKKGQISLIRASHLTFLKNKGYHFLRNKQRLLNGYVLGNVRFFSWFLSLEKRQTKPTLTDEMSRFSDSRVEFSDWANNMTRAEPSQQEKLPSVPVVLEYARVDRFVKGPRVAGVLLGEELLQDVPTFLHRRSRWLSHGERVVVLLVCVNHIPCTCVASITLSGLLRLSRRSAQSGPRGLCALCSWLGLGPGHGSMRPRGVTWCDKQKNPTSMVYSGKQTSTQLQGSPLSVTPVTVTQ